MQTFIIDCTRSELGGSEPITLAESKTQLRVTYSDDDTEITAINAAARRAVEDFCHISITPKRISLIAAIGDEWELPYGPVIGIEGVYTPAGVQGSGPVSYETDDTDWQIDGSSFVPETENRYKIIYTAGMSEVPKSLKQAILAQVVYLYENRGKVLADGLCTMAEVLAQPYQKLNWI